MNTTFLKRQVADTAQQPVRLTRKKRPDCPCVVRHRISRKWLVDAAGPHWSEDRMEARVYPSQGEARAAIRSIGGAVPFSLTPATSSQKP